MDDHASDLGAVHQVEEPTVTHSSSYKHAEYTPVSRASMSLVEAVQKASQRAAEGVNFSGAPLVTLTARQPYDPVAWLDFYKPGRWDTTYQDILMDSIVQGSSVGDWDGTAGYGTFVPPAAATYFFVIQFSGYQQTMRLFGPWGTTTARTATTADVGAVGALWAAPTAGQSMSFNFNCVSDDGSYGLSALQSVSILAV